MSVVPFLGVLAGLAFNVAAQGTPTSIPSVPHSTPSSTMPQNNEPTGQNKSNDNPNNDSGGKTNSPLLFFVALGFGVVFTNLWYESSSNVHPQSVLSLSFR